MPGCMLISMGGEKPYYVVITVRWSSTCGAANTTILIPLNRTEPNHPHSFLACSQPMTITGRAPLQGPSPACYGKDCVFGRSPYQSHSRPSLAGSTDAHTQDQRLSRHADQLPVYLQPRGNSSIQRESGGRGSRAQG